MLQTLLGFIQVSLNLLQQLWLRSVCVCQCGCSRLQVIYSPLPLPSAQVSNASLV